MSYVLTVSSKKDLVSNLICVESRVGYLLEKRKRREERNALRFIRMKAQQDSTTTVSLQRDTANGKQEISVYMEQPTHGQQNHVTNIKEHRQHPPGTHFIVSDWAPKIWLPDTERHARHNNELLTSKSTEFSHWRSRAVARRLPQRHIR